MKTPVHFHAWILVTVKWTDRHSILVYPYSIAFCSLPGSHRLFNCFNIFILFLFSLHHNSISFLPNLVLPSCSHRSRFSCSAVIFAFASLSRMELLAFFLICSVFTFLTSGFISVVWIVLTAVCIAFVILVITPSNRLTA